MYGSWPTRRKTLAQKKKNTKKRNKKRKIPTHKHICEHRLISKLSVQRRQKNLFGFCLWGRGGVELKRLFTSKWVERTREARPRENEETVWKQTQETFNFKVLHLSWRDTWTSWRNTCVRWGCVGAARGECFVLGCSLDVHGKSQVAYRVVVVMIWRTLVYSSVCVCVCVCFNQCVVYMCNYVEDFQEVSSLFLYLWAFCKFFFCFCKQMSD